MKKLLVIIIILGVLTFVVKNFFFSEEITVNYNQPLIELIKGGDYNQVFLDTTKYKFSNTGEKKIKVKLFKFNYPANQYNQINVLREISNKGYRPASLHELLEYKIKNSDPKISVIALGSIYIDYGGYKHYPILIESLSDSNEFIYTLSEIYSYGDRRTISLDNLQEIAFLAVKK